MTKILVSMDDKLLSRVDRSARRLGLSRSAYLARLVERDLGTEAGPGRDPTVRRALAEIDRLTSENPVPPGFDLTESIRKMRDSR
jgi:metal-responsive CopG/Arc/MetJ family transcriptional regulator